MSIFIERTGMRVIPALISFILLLLYIAPFFYGIINIGNCTGTFVTGLLTIFFTFNKQSLKLISALWNHSSGSKVVMCFLSVFMALSIISAIIMSIFMISTSRDAPKNSNTTLVVLGCQVRGTSPSKMLRKRLDAAYNYLFEHEEVMVIVSGGKGIDEEISEALCMKNYLVSRGIDQERIIIEDMSKSTYENLKFSKEIIDKSGLCSDITIVTDAFHQLRADMIAKDFGMNTHNISAKTSAWLVPTYWVREWFGIAYQFVFG